MTVDHDVAEPGDVQPDDAGTGASVPGGTFPPVAFAGLASIAAGAVHAAAAGIHAENRQLAQIFVLVAVMQLGVGVWALVRPKRVAAIGVVIVNATAVGGWLTTRLVGISWIDGLEVSEAPQFADTACAVLGLVAVVAAGVGVVSPARRFGRPAFVVPAVMMCMLAVWSMMAASTHVHSHDAEHGGDETAHDHGTGGADEQGVADATAVIDESEPHAHDTSMPTAEVSDDHAHDSTVSPMALAWPRPWDPAEPIDVSGVEGVSAEQERRAVELIEGTLRELPKYANTADAIAAGYVSIGDAGTGTEHYMKRDLVEDDALLDPTAPESLVYAVNGEERTLTGAMYLASQRPADDPSLTDWAGPLMTWHKHDNLCWSADAEGVAKVVGVIDANGNCARGVRAGGENPMVHVWIKPHPCGVFAALEGIGAGTASVPENERVDMCGAGHDHGATEESPAPRPYDPTLPIDLSGIPGVTPQQQAAAENLVAVTLVRLPRWSNYRDAEFFGFRSIGDAGTGHEHFIQWDWINDDVILDPDRPESLVYEPQPDGSKKLVSAMYMLPTNVALEDAPDIGGALMQWHNHDDLCFTNDPVQPRVVGQTSPDGRCADGLVKHDPSAMIHVWITPHRCGPFAALEGVGAGQIVAGQTRLCDHQHGSGP